jgi:hypothetical protein
MESAYTFRAGEAKEGKKLTRPTHLRDIGVRYMGDDAKKDL